MANDRKNVEVMVTVNKIILGYLAAVTKTDAKLVVCNLRDLATNTVERLQNSNKYKTWSYIVYPGTDLKMRVKCQTGRDHKRAQEDREAYVNRFHAETGAKQPDYPSYPKWSRKKGYNEQMHAEKKAKYDLEYAAYQEQYKVYRDTWETWQAANPDPTRTTDYSVLEVEFDIKRQPYFSMTQHEIDTVLIEDILLMPQDDEEDDERESAQPSP